MNNSDLIINENNLPKNSNNQNKIVNFLRNRG